MNQVVKEKLIQLLESGEYVHGKTLMKQIDEDGTLRHCCLGVLCELYDQEKGENNWKSFSEVDQTVFYHIHYKLSPSIDVYRWIDGDIESLFGKLAEINDESDNYDAVIDYLKQL